jgi:hypothetical protein
MHLQHAWLHEYLAHHVLISKTFLVVPQGHEGQVFEGQLPPHVLAKIATIRRAAMNIVFMVII